MKRRIDFLVSVMAIMFAFALLSPVSVRAQVKTAGEGAEIEAINRVKNSVLKVETVTKGGGKGSGSCVVLSESGYLVTNTHVLRDATRVMVVHPSKKKFHAVVIGKSLKSDIAVIRINAKGLRVPKWGNSKKLKVGQVAIAIGNPYQFEGSVSRGIISALNRKISLGKTVYSELIQTDAAINPGNSGGALIDSYGRVIGINTLVYSGKDGMSAQGIGFAIPIHRALEISKMLVAKKRYYFPKPWIGVNGMNITQEMADMNMLPVNNGVLLTDIQPASPAQTAGLQKGDIVFKVDEKNVRDIADFKNILAEKNPGDEMVVKLWRDGKVKSISLTVSQRSVGP